MTLTIEDFRTPMFDRQKVVKRTVYVRKPKGELAIEGRTFTDDFNDVGFTYYLSDGQLSVVDKENVQLFLGTISSAEEFEKALKKADKKVRKSRK